MFSAIANTKRVSNLSREYENITPKQVEANQLKKLNLVWQDICTRVPYYRDLTKAGTVPDVFDSLSHYRNAIPVTNKESFRSASHGRFIEQPPADFWRVTGGSTAKPVQMPGWASEYDQTRHDAWIGRWQFGIRPRDRLFLFWGHSHLLGSGLRGKWNATTRIVKDAIQNFHRVSAYNLDRNRLAQVGKDILRVRPHFIIGYASALDQLARANLSLREEFAKLKLKAVIGAAEAFPFNDSSLVIAEVFNAPVAMEYGSVETGALAHQYPDGQYRVFHNNYFVELINAEGGVQDVFVTSLYPRAAPLVRYQLFDQVEVGAISSLNGTNSLIVFDRVLGRSNSAVILPNGVSLHSEIVSHLVRDERTVFAYQFVLKSSKVVLRLVTDPQSLATLIASIQRKAAIIHPDLPRYLECQQTDSIQQSIAGKFPMVIDERIGKTN